jgi:hypothetical protein
MVLASVLTLATSVANAQGRSDILDASAELPTGFSGKTSGLVSGGGVISSNLEVDITAAARSRSSRGAEANASADGGNRPKPRKQPAPSNSYGFSPFATGFTGRTRDP